MEIDEVLARKIGGKQGVIVSKYLCILILIILTIMLLSDQFLDLIKRMVEDPREFFFGEGPILLYAIALIIFSFISLIALGYFFGKRAGHSIIIKSGNYLFIGWLNMFKTICFSIIIDIGILYANDSISP